MLSRRTLLYAAFAAVFLIATAAFSAYVRWDVAHTPRQYDGWQRIAWPFPRDGWDEGQAWRGHGLELYVRPKLGFCGNCDTGVVEDSEVDRVTDIDLVDPLFVPLAPGQRIHVTDLVGRSRLYRLRSRGAAQLAEAIAVSYRCDLVVAIVVGNVADEKLRRTARRFLEADPVQDWINGQLGER
ncbi:hypothetical protein [Reyranella sp.]|jgi:hypothetical protein|uniref:hypothetical protein n=1 Tax=Reyranella sp. TaxID=1929291 RepID=UPI002F93DB78